MKPRLRMSAGKWTCIMRLYKIHTDCWIIADGAGFGRTPQEAYADWARRG